ncbi:4-hydroxy-tetrahydrodipicolinate synthase [Paenibacillus herberti]|uniref:4-hydroxy-tetrahydrodipicolinate synthase n=1 Tax=Paenibacillus herberti TaxID=1619309 RepID=A0A229P1T8_9BACL|nr:4-hydroxy-tetrahydrodipicolinate synthase [Paenibacillus herberti]OXM16037.1 4-hydroxy-tetrahydrodipicolinate synthase [Paenibacillus herberti]
MDFGRLITAMATPFAPDGAVDWDTTGRLIDYLIEDQRTDSIVVSGTTGESPTLNDEEKVELFRFAVKHSAGRARIIAGTGSNHTAHSIHLTQAAEKAGVDGILLVVPYYNKPSQEGMYQHFKAIAESTSLPIMLYNVPTRTVASMDAATTVRLAQDVPNIVATKECHSLDHIAEIISGAPDSFRVYTGDDSVGLPAIAVGAYGVVSVASHVAGAQMKAMIEAYLEGRNVEAAAMHRRLLPLFNGLFAAPNPVLVKKALELQGLPVGGVRLPLVAADEKETAVLAELLKGL